MASKKLRRQDEGMPQPADLGFWVAPVASTEKALTV